jgi:hypothetical protein
MKYQLLTTDNRTLFVEYYLLEQFDDYIPFMELQHIFTIIPIPIPTYSYNYMKFILFLVEHYFNNENDIDNMYETEQLGNRATSISKFLSVGVTNCLHACVNYYIIECIEKNKICDIDKISNDLDNIRTIIVKLDNPLIICMIDKYLCKFSSWGLQDIPNDIKDGVNNTSSIF